MVFVVHNEATFTGQKNVRQKSKAESNGHFSVAHFFLGIIPARFAAVVVRVPDKEPLFIAVLHLQPVDRHACINVIEVVDEGR